MLLIFDWESQGNVAEDITAESAIRLHWMVKNDLSCSSQSMTTRTRQTDSTQVGRRSQGAILHWLGHLFLEDEGQSRKPVRGWWGAVGDRTLRVQAKKMWRRWAAALYLWSGCKDAGQHHQRCPHIHTTISATYTDLPSFSGNTLYKMVEHHDICKRNLSSVTEDIDGWI